MAHGNESYVLNKRFLGTFTVSDDTGTPIAFTLQLYGDLKTEDGGYGLVRHQDERGDFVSYPPNRTNANTSKITLKAKQLGFPGQTAAVAITDDLTIGDFVHQSGEYANLVSTLLGAGTRHEKTFDIAFTLTDGSQTSTFALTNSTVSGSFQTGDEANMYDLTFEAPQPFVTVTHA